MRITPLLRATALAAAPVLTLAAQEPAPVLSPSGRRPVPCVGQSVSQMREIAGGDGLMGQNSPYVHVGLGNATNADLVRIEWPSGIVQELTNLAAQQFLTVTEPGGEPIPGARWRLLDPAGMLLGIAEQRPAGLLHPVIVLV